MAVCTSLVLAVGNGLIGMADTKTEAVSKKVTLDLLILIHISYMVTVMQFISIKEKTQTHVMQVFIGLN